MIFMRQLFIISWRCVSYYFKINIFSPLTKNDIDGRRSRDQKKINEETFAPAWKSQISALTTASHGLLIEKRDN